MAPKPKPKRKTTSPDSIFRPLIVPRLLRRPLAAAYLSLSPSQLDLLRTRGDISPVPVPSDRAPGGVMTGAVCYDRNDLDELIERWKNGGHDADDSAGR